MNVSFFLIPPNMSPLYRSLHKHFAFQFVMQFFTILPIVSVNTTINFIAVYNETSIPLSYSNLNKLVVKILCSFVFIRFFSVVPRSKKPFLRNATLRSTIEDICLRIFLSQTNFTYVQKMKYFVN